MTTTTAKISNLISNINPHLYELEEDYLYHLYLGKNKNDLKEMFGDVKFVCMGGTSKRMHLFANYMKDILGYKVPTGLTLNDITKITDRYSMYKVGPILFVNHGIGCSSLSILLNEILKLIHHAGCTDVTFFRIGTCGGIGVEPGTVVITEEALDGMLRPEYRQYILGEEVVRKSDCDKDLIGDLRDLSNQLEHKNVVVGKTLCAYDFYEGQARVDGIFCHYTNTDKIKFLNKCKSLGVANIEMESLCFAGMLKHANVRFGIVCAVLLDRLTGDQVQLTPELLNEYQQRPFELVGTYIKNQLESQKLLNGKLNGKH